ncbi:hypothetical protein BDR22DRAFT_189092 [Usnea florida]
MACFMMTLPREILSLIFGSLDDLDDAQSLSQTCQALRDLRVRNQKIIDRAIVTSSDVFKYDLCLSHLLKLNEKQAEIFRVTESARLTDEQRPSHKALLEAIETDWNHHAVSNEDVDAITLRWREMGYLRDLYLDDLLSKEFDLFRTRFATKMPSADRMGIVQPGLMTSSTSSSRFKCSREYTHGFKGQFYQSLCLHSMAIATLQLAAVVPEFSEEVTRDHHETFVTNAYDLWSKQSVVLGGMKILLGWDVKLYCLEIFDFLYMFLLRKIFPFEMLEAWIGSDAHRYPFDIPNEPRSMQEWYDFLDTCRFFLTPHDIFDLIKHQAWRAYAAFPQSKSMYMRVRGMFNHQIQILSEDFISMDIRDHMLEAICKERPTDSEHQEEPSWWDPVRVVYGSPFLSGGPLKYRAEILSKEEAENVPTVQGVQGAN